MAVSFLPWTVRTDNSTSGEASGGAGVEDDRTMDDGSDEEFNIKCLIVLYYSFSSTSMPAFCQYSMG